jgi:predicted phage terminase large subunit-like protein
MFKMDRVKIVRELPPNLIKIVRGWDKAATEGGSCNSAGVKIGRYTNGRFIFLHVLKDKWSSADREANMLAQAELDGRDVKIVHEQEPGSGGKDSALATSRNLAAFDVIARTATGDKVARADPMSRAIERGDFDMLEGEWNQEFKDEMKLWPMGSTLDQGDGLD